MTTGSFWLLLRLSGKKMDCQGIVNLVVCNGRLAVWVVMTDCVSNGLTGSSLSEEKRGEVSREIGNYVLLKS